MIQKDRYASYIEELLEGGVWGHISELLRERLVNQEDELMNKIGLSDEELFTAMKRIAGMRLLLTDLETELRGLQFEFSNEE